MKVLSSSNPVFNHGLYAIFDVVSGMCLTSFQSFNNGTATRLFLDTYVSKNGQQKNNFEDLELWKVAILDVMSGNVTPEKEIIVKGINFKED